MAILPDEIDVTNADAVSDTLLALLNRGASVVIADMAGTRFCGVTGVRAVLRAHKRAQSLHARLRVVSARPAIRKVFRFIDTDRLVYIYPTREQALAVPRHQPPRRRPPYLRSVPRFAR